MQSVGSGATVALFEIEAFDSRLLDHAVHSLGLDIAWENRAPNCFLSSQLYGWFDLIRFTVNR